MYGFILSSVCICLYTNVVSEFICHKEFKWGDRGVMQISNRFWKKVHRLKSSAFWMSLCCHRVTWISFASFAFFLAGSFPSPTFFKDFHFFDPMSEQLDPSESFSCWSFFCSTWISPFFTSLTTSDTGQEVNFQLDYQYLDPLRHLNQRHWYFHLNQ